MKITKYNHACLLIEDNGKRLLIDPGMFTFNDQFSASNMGKVDLIIVTHSHQDHLSPENIKALLALGETAVVGGPEIKAELEKEGVVVETTPGDSEQQIADFTIRAFPAIHGPMPGPAPAENIAYLINGRLLHPGDSYATEGLPTPEILALPTQGPWTRLVDAIAFAKTLKPKHVIGMHNALLKDDFGTMMDGYLVSSLEPEGIPLHNLSVGQSLDL